MSKNNKVIVYIDENEDNMYYEELNKKGKMQISVYDEEFGSWIEYHHDIDVKSLQEYNDKKIANLETKLKEERNETLKYEKIYEDKIADLEAKLAEKELVLDKILTEIHTNCYSCLNIVKFKEMVLNDLGSIVIKHNQDKISFCIEQLENVRNKIHRICFFTCDFKCDEIMLQQSDKIIDNQIEEIKKEKPNAN